MSEMEKLIAALKACLEKEPSEVQLTELGESLVATVKSALGATTK